MSLSTIKAYARSAWLIFLLYAGTLSYTMIELGTNEGLLYHSQLVVFIGMWAAGLIGAISALSVYPLIVKQLPIREELVVLHRYASASLGLGLWVVCGIILEGVTGEFIWTPW